MQDIKIMVVDDESRMRKLVRDFLTREGYKVIEAGDGEEAVDLFYANRDVALIILDVMMPKMDGWQTCREIRAESKVPIIMLTAKGDEQEETLLLSPQSINKSIPVILCDEEDVEGTHGSTCGKLGSDELFYFQSRGITENDAEKIMTKAKILGTASEIPSLQIQEKIASFIE